jgi:hypothetical protein
MNIYNVRIDGKEFNWVDANDKHKKINHDIHNTMLLLEHPEVLSFAADLEDDKLRQEEIAAMKKQREKLFEKSVEKNDKLLAGRSSPRKRGESFSDQQGPGAMQMAAAVSTSASVEKMRPAGTGDGEGVVEAKASVEESSRMDVDAGTSSIAEVEPPASQDADGGEDGDGDGGDDDDSDDGDDDDLDAMLDARLHNPRGGKGKEPRGDDDGEENENDYDGNDDEDDGEDDDRQEAEEEEDEDEGAEDGDNDDDDDDDDDEAWMDEV